MSEITLSQVQSRTALYIFFRSLWDKDAKHFAGNGIGLGAFLEFINLSFEFDLEWKRAYSEAFNAPWNKDSFFQAPELFKIALALLKRYREKYKFDIQAVEKIVCEIQSNSPSHDIEKSLWTEAQLQTLRGEEFRRLEKYYFFDWCS